MMNFKNFIKLKTIILGTTIMLGCSSNIDKQSSNTNSEIIEMNDIEKKIVDIARKHVIVKYPNSIGLLNNPIVIKKNINTWQVSYYLSSQMMLGGTPVIHINANDFSIIKSYHEQ